MTTPALPSLFGRFTAILKDHDHLGHTLVHLKTMCAALEAGAPDLPTELAPHVLLNELGTDLRVHFAAEESADYFGAVLEEAPSLGSQIAELEREHRGMLASIERLRQLAQQRERWAMLLLPMRELIATLERHERSESVLLHQLFFPTA